MKYAILLFILILIGSCVPSNDSVIVVPRDYVGPVIILYDQSDTSVQTGNNYVLPKSGIIKTSDNLRFGYLDRNAFYNDSVLEKNKIMKILDFDKVPSKGRVLFGGVSHYVVKDDSIGAAMKYISYCIGNRKQIEDCYKEVEEIDYTMFTE